MKPYAYKMITKCSTASKHAYISYMRTADRQAGEGSWSEGDRTDSRSLFTSRSSRVSHATADWQRNQTWLPDKHADSLAPNSTLTNFK